MSFDLTGFGSIADFLSSIVSRVWPDKNKQIEIQAEINKALIAGELADHQAAWDNAKAQLQINDDEAKSPNLFVAGWRPFCGWIGGIGLLYAAFLEPLARFIAEVGFKYTGPFPVLDTTITMQVLFGMLGLGVMRSVEKVRGVSSGH